MNENWLIMYNRLVVGSGHGVFAKTMSFDHIIRGNVFSLKAGDSSMVMLATPDCSSVEPIGNTLYGGSGRVADGAAKPAKAEGNRVRRTGTASRPRPAVPSVYEWQVRNVR